MIDWSVVPKIAGGGFASVFLTLIALAATTRVMSLVVRLISKKITKSSAESLQASSQAGMKQPQPRTAGKNDS